MIIMQLYGQYELMPGSKKCKEVTIRSEDGVLVLDISFEYMPEMPKVWIYCCLEVLDGTRDINRFIENDGNDESKHDFMIRLSRWFKSRQRYYNRQKDVYLSWYTGKKMMLLVAKAFDKVFK